jgi:hypothetical protein
MFKRLVSPIFSKLMTRRCASSLKMLLDLRLKLLLLVVDQSFTSGCSLGYNGRWLWRRADDLLFLALLVMRGIVFLVTVLLALIILVVVRV